MGLCAGVPGWEAAPLGHSGVPRGMVVLRATCRTLGSLGIALIERRCTGSRRVRVVSEVKPTTRRRSAMRRASGSRSGCSEILLPICLRAGAAILYCLGGELTGTDCAAWPRTRGAAWDVADGR